jgi:hypothetical protein
MARELLNPSTLARTSVKANSSAKVVLPALSTISEFDQFGYGQQ